MKGKNSLLRFSLFIIGIFVSLAIQAQNAPSMSYMDTIILMNGGELQGETLPDSKISQKIILPKGAKLNETTLSDGNQVKELILSNGKKIQVYLNPNGTFIKSITTSPDGTITTDTMEGGVEHMTIQSPNGIVLQGTGTMKKMNNGQ